MNRSEGWEDRLVEFIEARRNMPFEWGPNDCGSFAICAVKEVTGQTVLAVTWDSALSAARTFEEAGGLEAITTQALGDQVDRRPRRGDIAIVNQGEARLALMVGIGGGFLAGPGVDCMEFKPVSEAVKVWRVG